METQMNLFSLMPALNPGETGCALSLGPALCQPGWQ